MNLRIWLLIAFVAVAAGCGMTEMFNTDPGYDYKKQPDGSVLLLDTPRMWKDWTDITDRRVRAETKGMKPEAGKSSWNDYWLWLIHANQSGREHSQKYINYIIEQRRAAGLPELPGYP